MFGSARDQSRHFYFRRAGEEAARARGARRFHSLQRHTHGLFSTPYAVDIRPMFKPRVLQRRGPSPSGISTEAIFYFF